MFLFGLTALGRIIRNTSLRFAKSASSFKYPISITISACCYIFTINHISRLRIIVTRDGYSGCVPEISHHTAFHAGRCHSPPRCSRLITPSAMACHVLVLHAPTCVWNVYHGINYYYFQGLILLVLAQRVVCVVRENGNVMKVACLIIVTVIIKYLCFRPLCPSKVVCHSGVCHHALYYTQVRGTQLFKPISGVDLT